MPTAQKFMSVIEVRADEAGKLPTEIQILPIGEWNTTMYGPLSVTPELCDQMISNFKANVRKGVMIDIEHTEGPYGGQSGGWIVDLYRDDKFMHAKVEWNKLGTDLVSDKVYRFLSPEWSYDYVDPQNSLHMGAVLIAVTLTNRPLLKELQPLTASEKLVSGNSDVILYILGQEGVPMDLEQLKTKPVEELTDEEKEFVKGQAEEMSDEDKSHFASVLESSESQDNADDSASDDDADKADDSSNEDDGEKGEDSGDAADAPAEGDEVKAQEQTVTVKADELNRLKAAEAKLVKAENDAFVNSFLASETNTKGVVAPKGKAALETLVAGLTADQRLKFSEVMSSLAPNLFNEVGTGESMEGLQAHEKLAKLAEAKVTASEGKLAYRDAFMEVVRENPGMFKEYEAARNS